MGYMINKWIAQSLQQANQKAKLWEKGALVHRLFPLPVFGRWHYVEKRMGQVLGD